MPRFSQPPAYRPYTDAPDGWDKGWKAAKAAGGNIGVLVHGDSILAGTGGTDPQNKSVCGLLKAALLSRLGLPLAAEFWAVGFQNAFGNYPWSGVAGTVALSASYGWGQTCPSQLLSSTIQTLTTPYACTDIDLIYCDNFAGTWTYTVDGGAPVTVTNTGNNTAANASVKRIQLTGLSNTTHTIAIGGQSANYTAQLHGAVLYPTGRSTTGLQFARFAIPGANIEPMLSATLPADTCRLWQGVVPNSDAGSGTGFGFPLGCNLAIFQMSTNDCAQNQSQANMITVQRRIAQAFQRSNPNASIIFLSNSYPDPINSDCNNPFAHPDQWVPTFIAAKDVVARGLYAAHINIHAAWGQTPFGKGFVGSSDLHPTDAGAADIMNTYLLPIL